MTCRAALVVALLVLVMGAGAIVAAPAPGGAPRIELITHTARGPLRAGDALTVTVRGTAGATATFDVFGLVADVRMREARPGVYGAQPALFQGTHIVQAGQSTRNAAVIATLRLGGQEVSDAAPRPVTIDTRRPEITLQHPAPFVRLANVRPNIVVNFFDADSLVDPSVVRLLVNGRNVTADASITETSASYNPQTPFVPGPVRLEAIIADRAGNAERTNWTFVVTPANDLIKSVTINPAAPLKSGEILTVVVAGVPGAEASFALEGMPGQVAMRESRTPGLYFGSYEARRGQLLLNAAVLVTLTKDGRRNTAAAATGVTVLGATPQTPTALSASRVTVAGARPETRIVMRGRSRPGYRILGRIGYEARGGAGEDQGLLQEFLARALSDGTWQFTAGPFAAPRATRIFATVVAIDPAGQQSPPVVVELPSE